MQQSALDQVKTLLDQPIRTRQDVRELSKAYNELRETQDYEETELRMAVNQEYGEELEQFGYHACQISSLDSSRAMYAVEQFGTASALDDNSTYVGESQL